MGHPETSLRAKGMIIAREIDEYVLNHKKKLHCHVAYFVLWHLQFGKKSNEGEQNVPGSPRFPTNS